MDFVNYHTNPMQVPDYELFADIYNFVPTVSNLEFWNKIIPII